MRTQRPGPKILTALLLSTSLCACSSGSSDASFVIRTTANATSAMSPFVVDGAWLVYLADEAASGAVDLNNDGDAVDDVAVALRLDQTTETPLRAARNCAVLGNEIYLVVDEADDGMDWDGDPMTDTTVLLHWSGAAGAFTFLDVLLALGDPILVPVGNRFYYTCGDLPVGIDETALRYVDGSAPLAPVTVLNQAGAGNLIPRAWAASEGLVFLAQDEILEAADLNGDGMVDDRFVLGLLDGTDPAGRVVNAGVALSGNDPPVDARATGPGDWLAAFLVDEAGQGAGSLNDPAAFPNALLPDSCALVTDADTLDEVLFFLRYADFVAGMPNSLASTGLAGTGRVLVVGDFVATLSAEMDVGCDLNEDSDMDDLAARWVEAVVPVQPPRLPSQLRAIADALPGGAMGLSYLGDRLVAVVDEAADGRDVDGKVADHCLVGWLDPADGIGAAWTFSHQSQANLSHGTGIFDSGGDSEPFAGASWLAAHPVGTRLGVTFLEEVPGTNPDVASLNNNVNCNFVQKDLDKTDALPVWADFEPGPTLDFDGVGFAVDADNAGIVVAGGHAFFRVDEAADARDYNNDQAADDLVLMRNPLTTCEPIPMATASGVPGPVIVTDGEQGAAFLSNETMAGLDFNGDGDIADLVVRYFTF